MFGILIYGTVMDHRNPSQGVMWKAQVGRKVVNYWTVYPNGEVR